MILLLLLNGFSCRWTCYRFESFKPCESCHSLDLVTAANQAGFSVAVLPGITCSSSSIGSICVLCLVPPFPGLMAIFLTSQLLCQRVDFVLTTEAQQLSEVFTEGLYLRRCENSFICGVQVNGLCLALVLNISIYILTKQR
jgi:hypothetical protein